MRALWVSQWYSSCDNNYHHRSVNCCDPSAMNVKRRHSLQETSGRSGKFMPQISRGERGINNKTYKKRTCKQNKHNVAIVTQMPRITHNDCWTIRNPNCLAEPLTPSLVTTEQARATTTKTTILLVLNQKKKSCCRGCQSQYEWNSQTTQQKCQWIE